MSTYAVTVPLFAASAVAVILAVPAATPVIIPSLLTVAIFVLLEVNVTFLTFVSTGV